MLTRYEESFDPNKTVLAESSYPQYLIQKSDIPALTNNRVKNVEFTKLLLNEQSIFSEELRQQLVTLLINIPKSPVEICESHGFSWALVLKLVDKDRREGRTDFIEALDYCKKAYAETAIFNPERFKGNASIAIFMAKSIAGWSDNSENLYGVPSNEEFDRIMAARESLSATIVELDKQHHQQQLKLAQ
jgi:hypothetical protein